MGHLTASHLRLGLKKPIQGRHLVRERLLRTLRRQLLKRSSHRVHSRRDRIAARWWGLGRTRGLTLGRKRAPAPGSRSQLSFRARFQLGLCRRNRFDIVDGTPAL